MTSQTLGDLLRRTRQRVPDKLAIQCGDVSWTYAEFDDICNRLASGLSARGVRREGRVAIMARNSHAFAAMRFAIARLGAILVPINFLLNAQEVRYILEHSRSSMLCVDAECAEVARRASADSSVKEIVWLPGEKPAENTHSLVTFDQLLESPDEPVDGELRGALVAQIVYTSGTESRPKGVALTHEAVISQYVSCLVDAEISQADRILHALPLYHCAQLDVFLGPSVYVGATNVITAWPSSENLLDLLSRLRITSFFAPPTVWIGLLRAPQFDRADLSTLRKGYYGASTMPVEVLKEMLRRLPEVRLWNLYGQTELAPLATVLKPEDQVRKAGSAGRPVLNVETRIVDDEMRVVARGQIGEIVHRSPQLLQCYYADDEATEAAFRGGWFHSGDLGVMDDEGFLTVVDRKKDMVKTGGENVSSREVEEALYTISEVAEVAVIGLPDARWVEAVTAIVVLKEGAKATEQDLLDRCADRLAPFKRPKRVIFTSALPKSASGKILKRELRLLHAGGPQE